MYRMQVLIRTIGLLYIHWLPLYIIFPLLKMIFFTVVLLMRAEIRRMQVRKQAAGGGPENKH